MARLLLVEDDASIAEPLMAALRREGHEVAWSATGEDGLASAGPEVDLVLLDLGLPDLDGLEVCRRLRQRLPEVPVLMLTARAEEVDAVVGLDAGADDYVTKPFRLAELMARIRAALRRSPTPAVTSVQDVRIDHAARRAWRGEVELELSAKEFDLLALLAADAGRAVTRDRIMREVWDEHWYGPTKTLDMHISWLRKKLGDDPAAPRLITTLRGVGFRFETG
ncbi:MAG TPA: response regulator transcription factor [Acidimicrobiia bacterium]|nr:response regulator transcription factor [Acidimicrobiia bacterium]